MTTKHPANPPSPYATVEVKYGQEYKHLYHVDPMLELEFHPSYDAAMKAAREAVADDANAIIAIMKVSELVAGNVSIQSVCIAAE